MCKKNLYSLFLLCSIVFFAQNSQANLIINGSFENNPIPHNSWKWFTASEVQGWDGSNIEIWHALFGIEAPDGDQLMELNAHPFSATQFQVSQEFSTEVGAVYDVSLYYRARNNNRESFSLSVDSIFSNRHFIELANHNPSQWSFYSGSFAADSIVTSLSLSSISPYMQTMGNLIDNVSVIKRTTNLQTTSVDEPANVSILLTISFLLMICTKRFKK